MRCWLSAAQAAYHSFPSLPPTKTRSLRCTAFFPPKPLRWVSAGALLGEVIKLPFCIFGISMWGWYHYPLAALSVSEQPRAGFISAEKRFSQSGCSAPTNALFPPAHSAFWALLCGGGITTLGVRFMPLKRWARRSYGGLFTVFMPSRNSPCAGRISPRRVHTPPQPLTAHTAAHTPKHGGFSGPMVTMFPATGSSTPSTLFRQISRSPLLFRNETKMPFFLRASTLFRI